MPLYEPDEEELALGRILGRLLPFVVGGDVYSVADGILGGFMRFMTNQEYHGWPHACIAAAFCALWCQITWRPLPIEQAFSRFFVIGLCSGLLVLGTSFFAMFRSWGFSLEVAFYGAPLVAGVVGSMPVVMVRNRIGVGRSNFKIGR